MKPVALAIMAKAPHPGDVKTRLCPPLTPAQAVTLARAFLRDCIAQVRALGGVRAVLAYTGSRDVFARLAPDFTLVPQEGADLGERMRSLLAALLNSGHRAAIVIGTDTPTLPSTLIEQAVDLTASGEVDLVLGPAEDGGYVLIGVRADHPTLFTDVPWSTPAVLDVTLGRARAAGLRPALLPSWYDVDTPADLARLRTDVAGDPRVAPATHRALFGPNR